MTTFDRAEFIRRCHADIDRCRKEAAVEAAFGLVLNSLVWSTKIPALEGIIRGAQLTGWEEDVQPWEQDRIDVMQSIGASRVRSAIDHLPKGHGIEVSDVQGTTRRYGKTEHSMKAAIAAAQQGQVVRYAGVNGDVMMYGANTDLGMTIAAWANAARDTFDSVKKTVPQHLMGIDLAIEGSERTSVVACIYDTYSNAMSDKLIVVERSAGDFTPRRMITIMGEFFHAFRDSCSKKNKPKQGEVAIRDADWRQLFDSAKQGVHNVGPASSDTNPDRVARLFKQDLELRSSRIPHQDRAQTEGINHDCYAREHCDPTCRAFIPWVKDLLPTADSESLDLLASFFTLKRESRDIGACVKPEPEDDRTFRARIDAAFVHFIKVVNRCAMTCPGGSEKKGCSCERPDDCTYGQGGAGTRERIVDMAKQAGVDCTITRTRTLAMWNKPIAPCSGVALKVLQDKEVERFKSATIGFVPGIGLYKQPSQEWSNTSTLCAMNCGRPIEKGNRYFVVQGGAYAHTRCVRSLRDRGGMK